MKAVVATLGYVFSPDGQRVLMLRRDARPGDIHHGKHVGLPLVFAGKHQFHGVMPYSGGRPTGWRYTEL